MMTTVTVTVTVIVAKFSSPLGRGTGARVPETQRLGLF
jgi:hypothetical protein